MASHTSRSRRSNVSYTLIIDNIPPGCVWQDLKDLTRRDGVIGRRSEVIDNYNGQGVGIGQIEIPDREQAFSTLERFINEGWDGRRVRSSLLKNQPGTTPVRLVEPTWGPRQLPQPRHYGSSSSGIAGTAPAYVSPPAPYVELPAYPAFEIHPAFDVVRDMSVYAGQASVGNSRHVRVRAQPTAQAPAPPINTAYSSTAGHPSRHTTPARGPAQAPVVTANRSIFLTNLPFYLTRSALRDKLQSFGPLEHLSTWHDAAAQSRRGVAKATFESTRDAAAAVRSLDGRPWPADQQRREIRCRFDRDAVAPRLRAPRPRRSEPRRRAEEPIIVDGTRGRTDSDSNDEAGSGSGGYSSDESVREVSRAMRHVRV